MTRSHLTAVLLALLLAAGLGAREAEARLLQSCRYLVRKAAMSLTRYDPALATKALEKLGYSPAVARRVSEYMPSLAREIVVLDMPPVTVYRGVNVGLPQYNPRGVVRTGNILGKSTEMWVTTNPSFALRYGGEVAGGKPRVPADGLLIEYQFPAFLAEGMRSNEFQIPREWMPAEFGEGPWVSRIAELNGRTMTTDMKVKLNPKDYVKGWVELPESAVRPPAEVDPLKLPPYYP